MKKKTISYVGTFTHTNTKSLIPFNNNREIQKKHLTDLKQSILKYGINMQPLIVIKCRKTGNYIVLEGNHRLEVFKQIEKDQQQIKILITEIKLNGMDVNDVVKELNILSKPWKAKDFLHHNSSGKSDLQTFETFIRKNKCLNYACFLNAMMGKSGRATSRTQKMAGVDDKLKLSKINKGQDYVDIVTHANNLMSKFDKKRKFVQEHQSGLNSIFKRKKFVKDIFISQLTKNKKMLDLTLKNGDGQDLIEEIYNTGLEEDKQI